jgi:hypothetical protein
MLPITYLGFSKSGTNYESITDGHGVGEEILKVIARFVVIYILTMTSAAAALSGHWIFEAKTGEGPLRGRLEFREEHRKLLVTFEVDNHVLKGEGETEGKCFEVSLTHSDGSGSGHGERIRLVGIFENDRVTGSFDSGTDRGTWVGIRE